MTTTSANIQQLLVRKRNGEVVSFDLTRIEKAIEGAFKEYWGYQKENPLSLEEKNTLNQVVQEVMTKLQDERYIDNKADVERIQDTVEIILMRLGHFDVARCYILYRAAHAQARKIRTQNSQKLKVRLADQSETSFDEERLKNSLLKCCRGDVELSIIEGLVKQITQQLYHGVTPEEIRQISILTAKGMIDKDSVYDKIAGRLLLGKIKQESENTLQGQFRTFIQVGIEKGFLNKELENFNLDLLESSLEPTRDHLFSYLGLQALYDRYLITFDESRVELPQYFWMRVAMGLAINEKERESKAIQFYHLISTFRYVPSTPTLFNSGTPHPQLSSCYLSTVNDDLSHIFKVIGDNAKLSKWAGGLGNDWTPIRSTNALIHGTKGKSQGLIPFLKIVNDTALAVNQGGKRKGAVCCYLETWHLDIEEFLDLRKNTGDDRRRTHDMNTANWIPDLFMKRVNNDQPWTLFSPNEVPDLHDLYGEEFEKRYEEYEQMAQSGKMAQFLEISARQLWRKILSRLFETGHPWITFKDPSNIRSMQRHAGVIHSSNLCTEILLNTSDKETAVCNLGSINLVAHIKDGKLDEEILKESIKVAVRMLDNVVDINFYPTEEARNSNRRHRPIGLGLMGFHDALFEMKIPYDSEEAITFADYSMECISYHTILASVELAEERGSYESYPGSQWSKGYVPIDTLSLLERERAGHLDMDRSSQMNWDVVREAVKQKGMRNCQVLAIAPTATISLIAGVSQSIEPLYAYLFVKSNLSGETIAVHKKLVQELKDHSLWDEEMLDELKYHDGSIQTIDRIPREIKRLFKTAFEIEPKWMIEAASRRQKWIDMGQSLNLYLNEPSGKKLDAMYRFAWEKGLKTTYYLRTKAATQVEKSTLDINKFGIQPKWMKNKSASSQVQINRSCSLEEGCESCQ